MLSFIPVRFTVVSGGPGDSIEEGLLGIADRCVSVVPRIGEVVLIDLDDQSYSCQVVSIAHNLSRAHAESLAPAVDVLVACFRERTCACDDDEQDSDPERILLEVPIWRN